MPGRFQRPRFRRPITVASGAVSPTKPNVPTYGGYPRRNTMTGAQLLQLTTRERRTLRKKGVNTARHERRVIHAEILRRNEVERRKAALNA